MKANWTSRLIGACAALFRMRGRDADIHRRCGELGRITVRFREHG